MSSWAKPGVKCVCIKADWHPEDLELLYGIRGPDRLPMLNEVLTISLVSSDEFTNHSVALSFVEMGHDFRFSVTCFRPLITKTQEDDAALFRHHLTGAPARVDA